MVCASKVKNGRYTPLNEPVELYFLNAFGANQRWEIQPSTSSLACAWSMPNGTTPSTGSRSGASRTSLRCTGVAQNGQRVAVSVPTRPIAPLQLGQTNSQSGALGSEAV